MVWQLVLVPEGFDNIFITQNIIDLHLVGSGSYVFPLYASKGARNE